MAELFSYAQEMTVNSITESLQQLLLTGEFNQAGFQFTFDHVEGVKEIVFASIVVLALIFGTLGTVIALRPMREALALQKRFISSVAHELRTPLAVLRVENEVAKLEPDVPDASSEIFTRNVEEIDNMTEILNNLLLFNRVNASESISFDMVDLNKVVDSVIKHLAPLALKRGTLLSVEDVVIPEVYGNATALKQVIFNLVKNAVNYTPKGGEVKVKCSAITEQNITISVVDNGRGIAKKDLQHIFEPFFRTADSPNNGHSTGLGLAIVFEIIKLHKGAIGVESAENKGTAFHITIPRKPQARRAIKRESTENIVFDFSK